MDENPVSIFWFRRDLRLEDNAGLNTALPEKYPVLPLFIFDTNILDRLQNRRDARVQFIFNRIGLLHKYLQTKGSSLLVKHGQPLEVFKTLLKNYDVRSVYTNRDYEPYAITMKPEITRLKMALHGWGSICGLVPSAFENWCKLLPG